MLAFIHPYQKIRRLEQEVADLRAQLDAATPSPSSHLLSMMKPAQSIGMLQTKGADLLCSLNTSFQAFADQLAGERATLIDTLTLINTAKKAVTTLTQHSSRTPHCDDTALTPQAVDTTLKALSHLQAALELNAQQAQALAVSSARETALSESLSGIPSSEDPQQPSRLALIADDTHRLAIHSQQLSHQLDQVIEHINTQVREHAHSMAATRQAERETMHVTHAVKRAVDQLTDQTLHIQKVIHHGATAAFLHSAKLDHAAWKARLYKHILSANTAISLEDHQQCRLGQWHLHGEDHRYYAKTEAYRALTAPHRRMHESGAEALTFAHQGDHNGQLAALGIMEHASQELALQLDKLMEHAAYDSPYLANQH